MESKPNLIKMLYSCKWYGGAALICDTLNGVSHSVVSWWWADMTRVSACQKSDSQFFTIKSDDLLKKTHKLLRHQAASFELYSQCSHASNLWRNPFLPLAYEWGLLIFFSFFKTDYDWEINPVEDCTECSARRHRLLQFTGFSVFLK